MDTNYTRQVLDIAKFEIPEDRVLVLVCIIILKNVNTLLIELGPIGIKAFLLDLKHDLLEAITSNQLGKKKDLTILEIEKFCNKISPPPE